MTPLITGSVPEQGQLVTVRQCRYVVTEVAKSTLPDRPLTVSGSVRLPLHIGDSDVLT